MLTDIRIDKLISKFHKEAYHAVEYVGMANYEERVREAKVMLEEATIKCAKELKDALSESATQEEESPPAVSHGETREQWILGHTLAAACRVVNAPFCAAEIEPQSSSQEYIDKIARVVAEHASYMMLEDTIDVLRRALYFRAELNG